MNTYNHEEHEARMFDLHGLRPARQRGRQIPVCSLSIVEKKCLKEWRAGGLSLSKAWLPGS